jgi:hypothetical protein
MTFCDNSDFAPLISIREGNQIAEMEEIARGEEFLQAGVGCMGRAAGIDGAERVGTRDGSGEYHFW